MKFKSCEHKYMMKANNDTLISVTDLDGYDFPKHMFKFKDFGSLKAPGGVDCNRLIDLIGRVVSITEPKTIQVNSKPQRLIDFVIEDSRGSRLTITLWEEHVDSVLPYYNADLTDPLLYYNCVEPDSEVRISSSYTATKILFNHECPELLNFKESMPRFFTPIRSISSSSRMIGSGSLEALSSENVTITSLKDIYDDKKVGEFWVLGEILGIESEWYFKACKSKGCGKKLQDYTDRMYCKACDKHWPDGIIKYKVVIDVLDDDQDGHLLLWDNICSTLLGITAGKLLEKHSEDGCLPNEIEGLIGKTMMFRIVTRKDQFKYSGNASFTVLRVEKDEAIVQTYQAKLLKKGDEGTTVKKLGDEIEFNDNLKQRIPPLEATSSSLPGVILVDDSTPEQQCLKRTNVDCSSSSKGMKRPKIEPKN
ncbi:PREDICTED: uncharacterized protein LOC109185225 [Ipomoea nil]|uniref:uncharacterized protein LOC109185225 n=1 Tax=Ipomoea nil TaxID=35883 RepID=UPI00090195BE|nr:PREDICTED: uncharacterized protein LOC109185225 [Ipomoea nil]